MYNRLIGAHHDTTSMPGMNMSTPTTGNWSTTLLWGRTKSLTDASIEDSYLLESLLQFRTRNYVWTRIENAGRSNELLLNPGAPLPAGFTESPHRPRRGLYLWLRPRLASLAFTRRPRRTVHHLHHTTRPRLHLRRTPPSPRRSSFASASENIQTDHRLNANLG